MEVLLGCWHEAQRADRMIDELRRIRAALYPDFGTHIDTLIKEIQTSSRLLRDLWDLFPIYESRTPMIAYHLEVILPCLCKTLMAMKEYVNRPDLIPAAQWLRMFDALTEEGRMPLWNRFVIYNEFLVQLIRLLSRSLLHDPTTLELLRNRILHLRLLRGIPEPPTLYPPVVPEPPRPHSDGERPHWATKVFEDVPHSVTSLRHRRESRCFGPSMSEARQGIVPGSSVLFKLPFDKNHLSITASLQPEEGGPNITRILCRYMDSYFHPVYSCYGVHELCVNRIGSSLQFRRYSTRRHQSTPWIALFFQTWERMVLFHCAFVSLKARCPLTSGMHPADYTLGGEKKLFQGKILDDGYLHSLAVFEEKNTFGLRLHAAVWDGELTRCPIWTAFITHQSTSPDWLVRKSRRRIWLMDIRPYVFCDEYQHRHQRQRHGEFEIHFVDEKAADKFVDIFFPESPASSVSSF